MVSQTEPKAGPTGNFKKTHITEMSTKLIYPDTIVFDLDGTLIDSLEDITNACNHALTCVNAPTRSTLEIKSMIGGGVRRLLARALVTEDTYRIDEARRYFGPAYRQCLHSANPSRPNSFFRRQTERELWMRSYVRPAQAL